MVSPFSTLRRLRIMHQETTIRAARSTSVRNSRYSATNRCGSPAALEDEHLESEAELAARFERDAIPLMRQLLGGARRLTHCHSDAEDLVQETMLKAYARFRTFREDTH